MLLPAVLAAVGVQRIAELAYAKFTARKLLAAGARFVREDGMGLIVATHALWFVAGFAESRMFGEQFGWWTPIGLAAFAAGSGLRYWSMTNLGWRWNTRVFVLPQAPLVASGPYRFLRHPIYVGVSLELAGLPAAFGLWRTSLALTALNGFAVLRRIRLEERALGLRA